MGSLASSLGLGALREGCELPHGELTARGDWWCGLERGLVIDVGGLVTAKDADDDFSDELGAQRAESATFLADLRLAQDVVPQRCLASPAGIAGIW